jgi:hypothetical protein
MTIGIEVNALTDVVRYFEELPGIAEQAAVLAVNQVAERDGMSAIRTEMRKEINFPKGYLEGDRLRVRKKASRGNIEAIIRGRDRATSLARFAQGQNPGNTRGRGVRGTVKPGQTRTLKSAFMVQLKNGNVGLAVRLKAGQRLENSHAAVRLAENVYLLYGPSVDQVFRGVADNLTPDIANKVTNQFLRQFARLSRG